MESQLFPRGFTTTSLQKERHPLDWIINPRNVAVIGASERQGSVGRTVLWNLISNPFGGTVYPVNIKRSNVLGIKAYPSVKDLPETVDLAVIILPAKVVPAVVEECGQCGIRGIIIISAGFKEMGAPGIELEKRTLEVARKYQIRIIGPNCLGVINPMTGLNATFGGVMARPGSVAFVSQSGALCTAILDWSIQEHFGFSAFISSGSMLDVDWGDLILYLGNDPRTKSIILYMEAVGDARSFLSAARDVARDKPIIVIKAGRTQAAAKAAASHTGSLTGSDEVLDAAFRRCGVLRVDTISDLFHMSETLGKQPLPGGRNLTIVTNAGGPGVLATDALILGDGKLTELSEKVFQSYSEVLPATWSRSNPVDIIGDAEPKRYAKALKIAADDPNSDGMLVILTPQDMTEPTRIAEELVKYAQIEGKPILASWMGGPVVAGGIQVLNRAGIPTFEYPDTAAKMFNYMWKYAVNLAGLYETPELTAASDGDMVNSAGVEELLKKVRNEGRTVLTEAESKEVLRLYDIPTVRTIIAENADEAVKAAEKVGYPVVVKINSETITHKSDVGGVVLNLENAGEVKVAFEKMKASITEQFSEKDFLGVTIQPMVKMADSYEVILGSSIDSQFGPVLLFGTGGKLVEVFKDSAIALPPLNSALARQLMTQTKIYKALKGVRGRKSADMAMLEKILVRFSQLVVEHPWIKELDINPLLVGEGGNIVALDARVLLFDPDTPEEKFPRPAIRPYPRQYVENWELRDGTQTVIRPIRPDDEELLIPFHEKLSDRSVRFRYFQAYAFKERVSHERLTRVCFVDYSREIALVAVRKEDGKDAEILGVVRMKRSSQNSDARFGLTINDHWQGKGLGTKFMQKIIDIAKQEKIEALNALMLPENTEMLKICKKLGFTLVEGKEGEPVRAELSLLESE